jgi:hypothetical protein
MQNKTPPPPKSLSRRSRGLWSQFLNDFVFSAAEQETLRLGLEALDRAEEARLAVEASGAYFIDRYGAPRPHPGIMVEHQARADWIRCARELQLTDDVEAARPPAIGGRYVQR